MAERVHESINSGAKTLMLSSKLPRRYYSCAQAYLAYVHNRTVHSGHSKTPYEYIYGKNPRVDQLQPFGAVGFAFVPHEKRNNLEPVRERVRLLGFGDDDDTTEMRGYHVLCESDLTRLYVTDVIFDPNITVTELDGTCVQDSDTIFRSITSHDDDEPEYILTDASGSTQIDEIRHIEDIPHESNGDDSDSDAELREQQAIIDEIDSRYDWDGTANAVQTAVPVSLKTAMNGPYAEEYAS